MITIKITENNFKNERNSCGGEKMQNIANDCVILIN